MSKQAPRSAKRISFSLRLRRSPDRLGTREVPGGRRVCYPKVLRNCRTDCFEIGFIRHSCMYNKQFIWTAAFFDLFEEHRFCTGVVLHARMIVAVLLTKIRDRADIVLDTKNPLLIECMRCRFDNNMCTSCLITFFEKTPNEEGGGSRPFCQIFCLFVSNPLCDTAGTSNFFST